MSRPHEAGCSPQVRGRADQPVSVPDGQLCAWCVDREPPRGHRKKLGGNRMTTTTRLPIESHPPQVRDAGAEFDVQKVRRDFPILRQRDRKSTRLNSSHGYISYAVFCLKKKKK